MPLSNCLTRRSVTQFPVCIICSTPRSLVRVFGFYSGMHARMSWHTRVSTPPLPVLAHQIHIHACKRTNYDVTKPNTAAAICTALVHINDINDLRSTSLIFTQVMVTPRYSSKRISKHHKMRRYMQNDRQHIKTRVNYLITD